jgi:hypothetical protein
LRTTIDDDELLIAAMLEPPALDQARASLDFWRQRRSRLPVYRRSARREANEMIGRWQARVLEAERRSYGTGLFGFVRRLLAGDPPSWRIGARGVVVFLWRLLPRQVRLFASAVAALWLLTAVFTLAAILYLLGALLT